MVQNLKNKRQRNHKTLALFGFLCNIGGKLEAAFEKLEDVQARVIVSCQRATKQSTDRN
jgi:hypothetical protein